jgi:dipeptidyl aminopeptidase/acylaminoacyl peptidase
VPEAPEVDVTKFAPSTIETYPARDGTKVPMVVRRPATCAVDPCPVIVSFHGGPEGQARPGFSPSAQLFVDAGFVYVEPNVRGSTGYGKSWLHADNAANRLKIITDIEDASKFIRTAWAKNGKAPKVGVVGGSYGGYSTLMAMTYFAGAYDAGVALYSIPSLPTFLMNTAPYRRILRISEYAIPSRTRKRSCSSRRSRTCRTRSRRCYRPGR